MNDRIYPTMVIKNQAEAIELLEKENQELKKQQKEFIEYLKGPIRIITEGNSINLSEYTSAKLDTLKEVLSKYKEIIGTDINVGSMGGKEC